MKRRDFIKTGSAAALGASLPRIRSRFDIILSGATIVDGTGGPLYVADVAITGDRISAIGTIAPDASAKVIDLTGQHLSPGFIDIHTHSDESIFVYPKNESRIMQGITTELTGNCGHAAANFKVTWSNEEKALFDQADVPAWSDVATYFEALESTSPSVNQAALIGQGSIRSSVIGLDNRNVTDDELKSILKLVHQGMEQGAYGLSTGLEYTPGRYTPTEELIEMARVVARYGGLYNSHMRDEEANFLDAVEEAIEIGRASGARVECAHLKAGGKANWGKMGPALEMIEAGRSRGVDVLADIYPYIASSTTLTIAVPSWALEGGSGQLLERMADPELKARMRVEMHRHIQAEPGGYDLMVISRVRSETNAWTIGKNFIEIAETWSVEPIDAVLRLLEEERANVGFIAFGMNPDNVAMGLAHPLTMVGSDGSAMAPYGPAASSRPHPRSYGTFPRVLGHYCREQKIFDLQTAVKKMTSVPADHIGIPDRGRIAVGKKADLVAFDAATVGDGATFDAPHVYPVGISKVFVNGSLTVEDGTHLGSRAGQVLRKT